MPELKSVNQYILVIKNLRRIKSKYAKILVLKIDRLIFKYN